MGRRPNPIISEYFTRGQKLADSSNRYAHTCKLCGEYFPKGRIDNLTSHLLRRCPNLTSEDRQHVLQSTQQLPLPMPQPVSPQITQRPSSPPGPTSPPTLVRYSVPEGIETNRNENSRVQREKSALDTLAEVSRRHLDYSTSYRYDEEREPRPHDADQQMAEQALLMQLRTAAGFHSTDSTPLATEEHDGSKSESPEYLGPDAVAMHDAPSEYLHAGTTAAFCSEQGDSPATRALDIDPQLDHVRSLPRPTQITSSPNKGTGDITLSWTPTTVMRAQGQTNGDEASMSLNPVVGFGMLQRTNKNHPRARFNDTRRKEVQAIRKRGACIRCRMLKKPCSEGTPCTTCRGVETARLWKTACIRTRLAEVFTLWSTGLFHTKAALEIPGAIRGLQYNATTGYVEVRFFPELKPCMTFPARKHSSSLVSYQSSETPELCEENHDIGGRKEIWLLGEDDTVSHKIGHYARHAIGACTAEITSPFLKASIIQAQESIRAARADQAPVTAQQRSCYNLQDQLLQNVVELWVLTYILAGRKAPLLQLHCGAGDTSCPPIEAVRCMNKDSEPTDCNEPISTPSKDLITTQLLAAAETRCSALSKTVTNELERRLLQRQQVSRFDAFLSATILLSCVERMTAVFRELDVGNNGDENEPPTNGNQEWKFRSWPLVQWPKQLWPQGERFADLLIMLLRMRGLQPPTTSLPDGRLVVSQDQSANGKSSAKPEIQEQIKMTAAWLDPIGLKWDEVVQIRDRGFPEQGAAGVKAWDMMFISRILLPEKE